MNKDINGAGYDPNIEDVPERFNDCIKCGGELAEKRIGDELYLMCVDCNYRHEEITTLTIV